MLGLEQSAWDRSWSRVRGSNSPPHDYKSDRHRPPGGAQCARARKHEGCGAGAVRRVRSVACRCGPFVDTSWTARAPRRRAPCAGESCAECLTVRVLRLAACCSALPPVDDQATWTTSLSRFGMTSGNDTMRRPSAAATRARGSRGLQAPPPFSSRETDCVVPIRAGGGGQFSAAEPEPKRRGRQYQVRHCRSRPPRRCVSAAGSPDVPSEAEEPPLWRTRRPRPADEPHTA